MRTHLVERPWQDLRQTTPAQTAVPTPVPAREPLELQALHDQLVRLAARVTVLETVVAATRESRLRRAWDWLRTQYRYAAAFWSPRS